MFLEYWMIAILMIVWVGGMISTRREGYVQGFGEGSSAGVKSTMALLERHGILDEEIYGMLVEKIKKEGIPIYKDN